MENPTSQITDWDWEEVVLPPSSPSSSAVQGGAHDGPHGGVIQSDYFSPDYAQGEAAVEDDDEGKDSESDNPSWVDPTDIPVVAAAVDGGGSSSSDEDSGERSLIEPHSECCDCGLGFGEIGGNHSEVEELGFSEEEEKDEKEEEEEKKVVVWWKVPIEVIKYCVFRVSPVWSLSMAAAALMGFVILRRRYLYNLKRKTLGIHLNVAVDDKKVSQFMSRAARLNEAFSVVKRVPIIRPALPAPGMAPWPVMSLR